MHQKKPNIALISIILNIALIIALIYIMLITTFPVEEKIIDTNPLGCRIEMIARTYNDKKTGIDLSIIESKSYYPQGQLATESIEVNHILKTFKSYSPDGSLLGEIINQKGRLIVPDIKGKSYPKDTVFPFSNCNCYYENGAYLTEEEFKKRKTEKFRKELDKFFKK